MLLNSNTYLHLKLPFIIVVNWPTFDKSSLSVEMVSWEIFSKWFFANLWSWAPSLSCQWDTCRSTNDQQLFFFNSFILPKEHKRVTMLQLFSIILVNIIKQIQSLEMLQFSHQQTNNRCLFWNRDWSYPQLWLASI